MNGRSDFERAWRSWTLFLACISLVLAQASAAAPQNGEVVGGGIGGAVGGWLAGKLGKDGDKTIRTLIGVSVGALVGAHIGKGLSKRDKEQVAASTRGTFDTGQVQNWTGKKGVSGRTELTGADRRSKDVNIPVIKERVTKLPPLDFINANYVAKKKDAVRGGPGADYREVAKIGKGEVVAVTGKVQEQPWYLISQGGVGIGFVNEKSLTTTAAEPDQVASVTGTVESKTVKVTRACRTVKQTVVQNGKEQSEDVTACQTENGWEIA